MLWLTWAKTVPTTLVLCAVLAWWFTEPKTFHLNLIVAIGCFLFCWAVAPDLSHGLTVFAYSATRSVLLLLRLDLVLANHATMIITFVASTWYVFREADYVWVV